ncbi:hypothetical protein BDA96_04G237200 [Sorghum bicolor]|uniref:Uncharacterized protein n=2 Tax=Sorghum bicolor TaxID=4558 RepID=A0A921R692_SORBI|nr:hypothetical protein BDA96_04G237200 [Sorghum bicolor]KXG30681.1 hypothetical protein SORBI_3004G222900 [Sorghum bicolor]
MAMADSFTVVVDVSAGVVVFVAQRYISASAATCLEYLCTVKEGAGLLGPLLLLPPRSGPEIPGVSVELGRLAVVTGAYILEFKNIHGYLTQFIISVRLQNWRWSTGLDHSDSVVPADLLPSHASAMQGVRQAHIRSTARLVSAKLPKNGLPA